MTDEFKRPRKKRTAMGTRNPLKPRKKAASITQLPVPAPLLLTYQPPPATPSEAPPDQPQRPMWDPVPPWKRRDLPLPPMPEPTKHAREWLESPEPEPPPEEPRPEVKPTSLDEALVAAEVPEREEFREALKASMEKPPPKAALPLDWDVEQHWHVELSETDRHILKQIAHEERKAKRRFEMVAKRHSNAFLLSGPAGWGKSHLGKEVFHDVGMPFFEVNSRVTPIMFFRLLWETRHGDKALFLDDIEDLLRHPHGVDLVKQAFPRQLGPRRVNWWTSAAPMIVLDPDDLTEEEMERFRDPHTGKVPKRARVHWLDYRGYGACIVNMDVRQEAAANKKLRLESLLDCMFNQEIRLRSPRQRMLRIARVVAEEGMLFKLGIGLDGERELMRAIWENHTRYWNLTLRTLHKVATDFKYAPDWKVLMEDEFMHEEPEDQTGIRHPKVVKLRKRRKWRQVTMRVAARAGGAVHP
jgi:hypothetical protein